jgi:hypothetical protein
MTKLWRVYRRVRGKPFTHVNATHYELSEISTFLDKFKLLIKNHTSYGWQINNQLSL